MHNLTENVSPPSEGHTQRIAVSTTGARTALADTVKGVGWVRVKAVGAEVQLQFGGAAVAIPELNATAMDGTAGWSLLDGEAEDYYLSGKEGDSHVAWDASGAGFLVIMRAGRKRSGQ
jgi:hypothetical protein